ncbi:hypothetical protein M8C21_029248, partial [Ambrosia artemisiifolia]
SSSSRDEFITHEDEVPSSASASLVENLELFRSLPELSNAWNGVDVNAWHKRAAYQVAVYGLLKAAIEVELFLSHKRCNTPVYEMYVEETTLAILGIFAYLGRETRLYLSEMDIMDMDDQIKNFLCYLECGSLYIYREFNSLPKYQLFNEVVIDEIGWVDFYASLKSKFQYDGRRSRQHAIQAEKEIIVYTVLTVCYDVFSGLAHYTNSSQQPLDSNVLSFLLQSQTLLSSCLEGYWAAYDKSGLMMKFTENVATDSTIFSEVRSKPFEFAKRETDQVRCRVSKGTNLSEINPVKLLEKEYGAEKIHLHEHLLRKSREHLISATNVFMMGTRLLFIDVADFISLLVKQLRGKKITSREKRKIRRTLKDIVNLVPITIIMIIPMSAVGHAAVLAAINKYVPSMIPSPYSPERLNLVRQFKRIKKMQVKSWAFEDQTAKDSEDKSFTVAMP